MIERDGEIDDLYAAIADVVDGTGRARAITGESGAGKSTVVREVCARATDLRVLRGSCDALSTPRPFGPFRDVVTELGRSPSRLGEGASSFTEFCEGIYDELRSEPTILVIEDAQWSDEASIDVVRFLLRRLEAIPTLLLVTYRDGEIHPGHPLRPLLGDIARLPYAATLALMPLSMAGVRAVLGESELDPASVHELTGGNAFYVSEIARHGGTGLPPSVRDVVLANTSELDPSDFEALQVIAAAPDGLDDRLLPLLEIDLPTLRRLDATGLLARTRRGVAFHHELARLAVESSIPVGGAIQIHARIVDGLERLESDDHAALTHHAVEARDPERIGRFARAAAAEAIRAGSHTEAVAFLELAVDHHRGPVAERAQLFHRLGEERYMINQLDAAIDAAATSQRLWREVGDPVGEARSLEQLATYEYYSGRQEVAEGHAERAMAVARDGDAQVGYGHARALRGYLALRRGDFVLSRSCHQVASEVADDIDDEVLRVRALVIDNVDATARGEPGARARLLDAVDEAMSRSLDAIASMGLSNLTSFDVEQCRLREADELLARSLPFTVEREIKICNVWQRGVRARLHLMRGRWEAALEDALPLIDEVVPPLARCTPHLVIGLVELRRHGDDDGHLEAAWRLAERMKDPVLRLASLAALAERTWLKGIDDERLRDAHQWMRGADIPPGLGWSAGNLAVWLGRSGLPVEPSESIAEPFRSSIRHDPSAATAWLELGAPFEAAMASLDSADIAGQSAAIEALDGLGATATADRSRLELRNRGITNLPTRPRASTRANPAGLTNRQLEVARLMAKGLTNAELADRLFISTKTADHHASAVLSKLGLSRRREVASLADMLS
jgi:DNA-binding CsgD family transcriptional regulator